MPKIKIVPIYFPQFHEIRENNFWWGKGFTDWREVKNGRPLFEGHHQPRIPLNGRYYDLTMKESIEWQIDLAKEYGIYGFQIYHYWFDGKLVLEQPKELFLSNEDLDIPISLNWANEGWTTRWKGGKTDVIFEQNHEPSIEKWEQHFLYLLDFFRDKRYIKIDGKPIFTIYRPHLVKDIDGMISYWQKRAKECGFDGIYMIAVKSFEIPDNRLLDSFDACMHFQPFEIVNSPAMLKGTFVRRQLKRLPKKILDVVRSIRIKSEKTYKVFDYDTVCSHLVDSVRNHPAKDVFQSIFMEWDNAARYKERATIYRGCTPERFEYWLDKLSQKVLETNTEEKIIFINAWNEWAEGTYLEPDENSGYGYLEAVRRCVHKYD